MRRKDLFPEVDLQLRKGYVSVEELVRELSHKKSGLFLTTFLLSAKAIFFTKRQDHSPHKLVDAHHNLGSWPVTPSCLGGKPPRVTNVSVLVDAKLKCSSY
jgi:hypothetical protein